jgi:hypothetical protein
VLAQHVVTVALGGGFEPEQLLHEVRTTRAYAELRDDEWRWVIDFLTNGGDALRAYPEYSRIVAEQWAVRRRERRNREAPSHVDRHDRRRCADGRVLHEGLTAWLGRRIVHRRPQAR